jgi:hypothetical protein
MDAPGSLGQIDLISPDAVAALGAVAGPCVSVCMPTHRHGPETLQGPVRLRNLVERAARDLAAAGTSAEDAAALLAPVRALLDDAEFWQHQGDGLAVFAAPRCFSSFRLPMTLVEEVTVGSSFRVVPLVPLLSGDGRFFILALSQNSVRLFDASRHRIGELDRGPIPASMDEALAHEDPERQLQVRSGGEGTAQFHGHGAGDEIDKAAIERYLRAVDRGLTERIGSARQPLVLASVGYYLPILRSVSSYPSIVNAVVEGNPEHRSPEELHASAWPLVEGLFAEAINEDLDRFGAAAGTGRTTTATDEVADAARGGRVDLLFVVDGAAADERVDGAVLDTLAHGGRIVGVSEPLDADAPTAALLRY